MHYAKTKLIVDVFFCFFLISCGNGVQPPTPTVLSVSPSEGPSTGGTTLTFTGINFNSDTTITIGGEACTHTTILSGTTLTCTAPAHYPAVSDIITSDTETSSILASGFNFLVTHWEFVDGNGSTGINKDTTKNASQPQLISYNNKLYSSWTETNGTNSQVRVAVYQEDTISPTWSFVDGNGITGLNKNSNFDANGPILEVFNSKLYLTWAEDNGVNTQIRVAVYNSNDASPNWSFVDGNNTNGINKDTSLEAYASKLIVFNSKLYAAWQESNGSKYQMRIAVYNSNDSNPIWTFVDGNGVNGINKNTSKNAEQVSLLVFNSKLYLTWYEKNTLNKDQIRVAVFNSNDSAPNWQFVDGNGNNGLNYSSSNNAYYPVLTVLNSKMYLAWAENSARVAVYNSEDNSPQWTFVDGNGSNGLQATNGASALTLSLVNFNSVLYLTWDELDIFGDLRRRVHSMRFDGNDVSPSWTLVDGPEESSMNKSNLQNASYPKFTVSDSRLYSTWHETLDSFGTQIRVKVAK